MPNILREDIDALNVSLTLTIERSDYEEEFERELNKVRKGATLKGFRKGKTPANVLRKMYGREIMAQILDKMVERELSGYIDEQKLNLIVPPITAEDQPANSLDVRQMPDFIFKFDLGLAPNFELKGISAEYTYERYEVQIPDSKVEEMLEELRRRAGDSKEVEGTVQETDSVIFAVRELDGDTLKAGGVESEFTLDVANIYNKAFKTELLGKSVGDVLRANLWDLLSGEGDDYIRHELLGIPKEDKETKVNPYFEMTIQKIQRSEPAVLDKAFFEQTFGEGVTNREEALQAIRAHITGYHLQRANDLLFKEIQEKLMELNNLPLPEAFLKRWIKTSNSNAHLSEGVIEREYPIFAKNLQWSLLKSKMQEHFQIKVTEQDIRERIERQVTQYFANLNFNPGMIGGIVDQMMENKKRVQEIAEEVLSSRLFNAILQTVTIVPKPVDEAAFDELFEAAKQQAKAEEDVLESMFSGEEEE